VQVSSFILAILTAD